MRLAEREDTTAMENHVDIHVGDIFIHKDYKPPQNYHDIALVKYVWNIDGVKISGDSWLSVDINLISCLFLIAHEWLRQKIAKPSLAEILQRVLLPNSSSKFFLISKWVQQIGSRYIQHQG